MLLTGMRPSGLSGIQGVIAFVNQVPLQDITPLSVAAFVEERAGRVVALTLIFPALSVSANQARLHVPERPQAEILPDHWTRLDD